MDVKITGEPEAFVRRLLAEGAYADAAEVVADALRALEEAAVRRDARSRMEKFLEDGLDPGPPEGFPAEKWEWAKKLLWDRIAVRLESAEAQIEAGRVVDGEEAVARVRARLRVRRGA